MSTSRRRFLRSSALAAAAVSVAPLAAADKPATPAPSDDPRMLYYDQFYFKEKPVFRFEYPFDGGVLQEGAGYPILGTETGADGVKRLRIHVVVQSDDVSDLQVFDPEGIVIPMEHISGALMGTALLKDRLSLLIGYFRTLGYRIASRHGTRVQTDLDRRRILRRLRLMFTAHAVPLAARIGKGVSRHRAPVAKA